MNTIDLHTHSNASDGTCSPTRVVELALQKGLRAVALTDHDTVQGIDEALAAAKAFGCGQGQAGQQGCIPGGAGRGSGDQQGGCEQQAEETAGFFVGDAAYSSPAAIFMENAKEVIL